MGKSKKFSSGSRSFIYAASRLEPITKTIIELEEDVKDINNRLMNVKSPSTSSIGEQNMRQSELEKELKKYDLRDKKEEILERKRQLKSLSRWIYKMFDKMSPYYKYFIFVTYVKKNKTNIEANNVYCLTLDDIVNDNLLSNPVKNAKGEEMDLSMKIKVTVRQNNYDVTLNVSSCSEVIN